MRSLELQEVSIAVGGRPVGRFGLLTVRGQIQLEHVCLAILQQGEIRELDLLPLAWLAIVDCQTVSFLSATFVSSTSAITSGYRGELPWGGVAEILPSQYSLPVTLCRIRR